MPILSSVLRAVIKDQQQWVLPSYTIAREKQSEFKRYLSDDLIVILSGLRRSGKSTLLHYLRAEHPSSDYYLNFDDERLATFKLEDFQVLYELFIELFGEQKNFYFDEIQNIPDWERFVRRLQDQGKKVWITGSNASMLSYELGTRLTGRYRQIELLPFSFREFLRLHEVAIDDSDSTRAKGLLKRYFSEYLLQGGIPGYLHFQDPLYLPDLYEGIIYRDIVARYGLTKITDLKELAYHAASNIAKPFSYKKMQQMISVRNATTVKDYFQFLEQSYLLFLVSKFDFSTKRQLLAPKKLYFVDTGLARTIGFRTSPDSGRLLENVVYLELRRQGHKIYYFHENKECDFVTQSLEQFNAIQVCESLQNKETMNREISGLLAAMENLQIQRGLILTNDETNHLTMQHNHTKYIIDILPVWKWLLNQPFQIASTVDLF